MVNRCNLKPWVALVGTDQLLPRLQAHLLCDCSYVMETKQLQLHGASAHCYRALQGCMSLCICFLAWEALILSQLLFSYNCKAGSIKFTINSWWGLFVGKYWDTSLALTRTLTCITAPMSHVWQWQKPFTPSRFACVQLLHSLSLSWLSGVESGMDCKH